MKLAGMQKNGIGSLPEYGAIFMSNSVTKEECLRRKLFGLSPNYGHFVKKIKAGMILFLFEYKKRELYGVFEACSDGGINIVPDAFMSSGKSYPAQVKVKSLWICDPLSECEFRDAIKENYFTAKKFNFGLSEVQVIRLLELFSLKKVVVNPNNSRNAKFHIHSIGQSRQVDTEVNNECVSGFNTNTEARNWAPTIGHLLVEKIETGHSKNHFRDVPSAQMQNELQYESNNSFEFGSAATTEHSQLDKVELEDSKFPVYGWVRSQYCPNAELHSANTTHHIEYRSRHVSRAPGADTFLINEKYQNKFYRDNCYESSVLSEHSSMLQPELGRSVLSRKHLEIRNPVSDQTTTKPLLIQHQMEAHHLSNISSKESYIDAIVMSTHPSGSVIPCVNYRQPSVEEVKSVVEGHRPYYGYGYSSNAISSLTEQPFSSHAEGKGMTRCLDKLSTIRNHASFSGPSPSDDLYQRNAIGLSQAAYSKSLEPEHEKKKCYDGLSLSTYSFAQIPSLRTKTDARENNLPFFSPGPSKYPSSLVTYGYQEELEIQPQTEAARKREREFIVSGIASADDDPFAFQSCPSPANPQSLQDLEQSLLKYDSNHYQSFDAVYSQPYKSRTSVFSRLALAQDAHVPEYNSTNVYESYEASESVNETMEVLHNSNRRWVKLKKPLPGKRENGVDKIISERHTIASHGGTVNGSKRGAKAKKLDFSKAEPDRKEGISLAGLKQVTQMPETDSFFNFKRRSEVEKFRDNGMAANCDASSRREPVVGGPLKRRKLVRPDFSKRLLCDDKGVNNCTSISQEPAEEISFTKDNAGGSEASLGNQDDKNTSLLSSNETLVLSQCRAEDVVFNSERREDRHGSCMKSLLIGVENGKESPINDVKVQNATISKISEGDNLDILQEKYCSDPSVPESFLKFDTRNESRTNEGERNAAVELLPTIQISQETSESSSPCTIIDTINCSIDQINKMLKETKNTANIPDPSKENDR